MVRLTVYSSAGDFDISTYTDVDKLVEPSPDMHYYTNNDRYGATMFSYETFGPKGRPHSSPLFLGHATVFDFAAVASISGRIGGHSVAYWLAHENLADYTPETLVARIFVGDDTLRGSAGGDLLDGHAGADRLMGLGGDDVLIGGVGDDILVGGFGTDTLTGGFGADTFVYRQRHDLYGGQEVITDFSHADGDKIDLRPFDADLKTDGERRISFIGEAQFNAAGVAEVRVAVVSDTLNVLQFDTDGNGHIDAVLNVYTDAVIGFDDVLTGLSPASAKVDAAAFGHDAAVGAGIPMLHLHQFELPHGVQA